MLLILGQRYQPPFYKHIALSGEGGGGGEEVVKFTHSSLDDKIFKHYSSTTFSSLRVKEMQEDIFHICTSQNQNESGAANIVSNMQLFVELSC